MISCSESFNFVTIKLFLHLQFSISLHFLLFLRLLWFFFLIKYQYFPSYSNQYDSLIAQFCSIYNHNIFIFHNLVFQFGIYLYHHIQIFHSNILYQLLYLLAIFHCGFFPYIIIIQIMVSVKKYYCLSLNFIISFNTILIHI